MKSDAGMVIGFLVVATVTFFVGVLAARVFPDGASAWPFDAEVSTAIFTLLLAIISAITAIAIFRQLREMTAATKAATTQGLIAERAIAASNRAWIKLNVISESIVFDDNGARITVNYVLKNIGHSPALKIMILPKLIFPIFDGPSAGHFNPQAEFDRAIREVKTRSSVGQRGHVLFPDDTITQPITVIMTKADIAAATSANFMAIYPAIIAVVVYQIGFDEVIHQTAITFDIGRSDTPRPFTTERNRSPSAVWVDEGDVPASDVVLRRSTFSTDYAD